MNHTRRSIRIPFEANTKHLTQQIIIFCPIFKLGTYHSFYFIIFLFFFPFLVFFLFFCIHSILLSCLKGASRSLSFITNSSESAFSTSQFYLEAVCVCVVWAFSAFIWIHSPEQLQYHFMAVYKVLIIFHIYVVLSFLRTFASPFHFIISLNFLLFGAMLRHKYTSI